jgi:NADPH:quinone reductase-like Zn-dependent oxidoreductase
MAEAVGAPFRCLAPKPASLSWNEAGGLPLAGLTAYQALTEALGLQAGQTLFVSAASGGVGSFAVQLARVLGAQVVGTTSASHADWVGSLGAEPVDYTGGDVVAQVRARHPQGVDAVLDLVGGDSLAQAPELLADGGRLASVVDPVTVGRLGGRYVFVRPESAHLEALGDLATEGKLGVWVEEAYPLDEAGAALQRLADGHVQGKLVVQVST